MDLETEEHFCFNVEEFPLDKFHQTGHGKGKKILLVGESPAATGWRVSGMACYDKNGKILATGKRLNELLVGLSLSVQQCGFTELTKCFVGKSRNKLGDCSKKCWPIFVKQLEAENYKLLILLGVETTKLFGNLINQSIEIGQISNIVIGNMSYKVLPIFHPSPINPNGHKNNQKIFGEISEEIEKIIS